jgi:hypothetical protein
MRPSIRSATQADAEYIAEHLRDADRRELVTSSLCSPADSLRVGVRLGQAFVWDT